MVDLIDLNEVMPKGGFVSLLGQTVCGINTMTKILCGNTLFAICGFNPKQLNTTILPLILAHIPAGSSTKQLLHYAQEINSGKFHQYDYGFFSNLKRYSSWKSPNYDLSKITAPLYFFYSTNDWISSSRDVNDFAKKLTSLRGKFLVSDYGFDHMDYLFGIQAPQLVYQKILSLMTRH
jgi:lysosomal acid lipase/cholesteryl ester hydrolase